MKSGKPAAKKHLSVVDPGPGPWTIDNILAITCPACQVGPGQVCDGSAGGTYDATSRGIIHSARAAAAGLTVSQVEVVQPYGAPGTAVPATATIAFAPTSGLADHMTIVVPDGVGGTVTFEVQTSASGFVPTSGDVTLDLSALGGSGTAEQVRVLFDALLLQYTALAGSSTAAGVETLSWPIPGTVGNGQAVTASSPMVATSFANGSGTSTLAFAKATVTINTVGTGVVNHDTLAIATDQGLYTFEFETSASGYTPTPGDVQVDLTAAFTAADAIAALQDAIDANTDFLTEVAGSVLTMVWSVAGTVGNNNAVTAALATPSNWTTASFSGGSD
jgi:hypothetical protein